MRDNENIVHVTDVQEEKFKTAIQRVVGEGFTSFAKYGASGETILLYGKEERRSSISVRLHSAGVELLVCNKVGAFLFYGKFYKELGSDFIAKMFKQIVDSIGYGQILSDTVETKTATLDY